MSKDGAHTVFTFGSVACRSKAVITAYYCRVCDMHFMEGFCNVNARDVLRGYQNKYPD
jgi:hypothetical protein